MATGQWSGFIRHLRRAALLPDGGGMTDGQLLECFITRRDEAAFAALVRRHGPMVLGVCRRVLGNHHYAEDAFQVTFLVLARKATSVGQRELLGNWLYGAAYRAALEAKAARRRVKERQVSAMPEPQAPAQPEVSLALRPVLDQELSRLPDKYRVPVVLCDLEGRTRRDVARQLNIPAGTLSGRLTTARRLLAKRLARHGLAVPGGALAATLSQNAASACVPSPLVGATVKAAVLLAAGQAAPAGLVSAKVAALTEGVLKTMLLTKLKIATAVLLVGVLAGGAAMLALPPLATGQTHARKTGKPAPAPRETQPADKKADEAQAAKGWKERLTIKAPDGERQTLNIAVSPDGKKVAVGYFSGHKVLDTTTGKELATLPAEARNLPALAFSPDGKLVAQSETLTGEVFLCAADSGAVKAKLEGTAKRVGSVAFSPPDGKILAITDISENQTVGLWDLATNKELHQFKSEGGGDGVMLSIAFSPDGKKLASKAGEEAVKVWEVATGKELAIFKHADPVVGLAFSPDGKTVAAGYAGKPFHVTLWDLATGKERATLKGPVEAFNSLAFSPDGKVLAVAGRGDDNGDLDNVVRLWDPATGKQIDALKAHQVPGNALWGLAFSRDGTLFTVGNDAVRIWEMEKK
jgi:RNA polymerase sigma factor (sigma-70 family)